MNQQGQQQAQVAPAPQWLWGLLIAVVFMLLLIALAIRDCGNSLSGLICSGESRPAAVNEETRTLWANPGVWSDSLLVPPFYWCRIHPEGKIRIHFLDGREVKDGPSEKSANWLGDNIPNCQFKVMGLETTPVRVQVILQPKGR